MAHARVRVDLPDAAWKAGLTRQHPDTVVSLSNAMVCGDRSVEVAVIAGRGTHLDSLREHPDISEVAVLQRAGTTRTVQVETVESALLSAARQSGTPLAYPIEVQDGEAFVDVVSTHDRISAFGTALDRAGLGFEVTSLRSEGDRNRVLTDRQREVVLAGVEHGYYETPRRCSLTELAREMDIAKSTCSGTLRRAEGALVEHFLTDGPDAGVQRGLSDRPGD